MDQFNSKGNIKTSYTALREGWLVYGGLPAQRASNTKSVSMLWHHHIPIGWVYTQNDPWLNIDLRIFHVGANPHIDVYYTSICLLAAGQIMGSYHYEKTNSGCQSGVIYLQGTYGRAMGPIGRPLSLMFSSSGSVLLSEMSKFRVFNLYIYVMDI